METQNAVGALSALAHPGRLEVFRLLVQAGTGGMAAGDIARATGSLANTLSTNLNILAGAGLVPAMTVDIDADLAAKCDDMWLYRSQTSAPTIAEIRLHAQRLGSATARHGERLWRPC